ncbi:MAG: Catabolite control protein A [Candidatus Izimaplasma bacterium HR2]|nr:MAG: Catabolite control protein A [Candidatus Izimaplasma bacterium HR2]
MYTMSVLTKLGYSIPDDVQVIGYDNIDLCEVLIPRLTTIAQPIIDMGIVTVDKLLKLLNKKDLEELHSVLPVELIERDSTK